MAVQGLAEGWRIRRGGDRRVVRRRRWRLDESGVELLVPRGSRVSVTEAPIEV